MFAGDLEKLLADADEDSSSPEGKIRKEQQSSDSSQGRLVLPKKCNFCNKVVKYSKANRTCEKLTICETFSADHRSDDLHWKNAMHSLDLPPRRS